MSIKKAASLPEGDPNFTPNLSVLKPNLKSGYFFSRICPKSFVPGSFRNASEHSLFIPHFFTSVIERVAENAGVSSR